MWYQVPPIISNLQPINRVRLCLTGTIRHISDFVDTIAPTHYTKDYRPKKFRCTEHARHVFRFTPNTTWNSMQKPLPSRDSHVNPSQSTHKYSNYYSYAHEIRTAINNVHEKTRCNNIFTEAYNSVFGFAHTEDERRSAAHYKELMSTAQIVCAKDEAVCKVLVVLSTLATLKLFIFSHTRHFN